VQKNILTFFIFIFIFFCKAQQTADPKTEKVHLDTINKTKNCYTIIFPSVKKWRGCVFLIPGFGETAENVLKQTDLPNKLALNGFLTIIPTFQDGVLSLGVDDLSQKSFDLILKDVVSKFKFIDQEIYLGGFSIGGSCAIKYAENSVPKPIAVFAIDPPLDFERFYNSAKRDVRLSKNSLPNPENIYMINRLEKETGGSPSDFLNQYYKLSPYSFSDTNQTAVKKTSTIPLRIYSEPDLDWWLKERGADISNMNISDCSSMINELVKLGNKNAELIISQNKGLRKPDNRKHPHSWSIVDSDELINWLISMRKNTQ